MSNPIICQINKCIAKSVEPVNGPDERATPAVDSLALLLRVGSQGRTAGNAAALTDYVFI